MPQKFAPTDATLFRQYLEIGVKSAIKELKQGKDSSIRVLESSIQHDNLQPEGEVFNIRFRVEVHEKEKKEDGVPVEKISQS